MDNDVRERLADLDARISYIETQVLYRRSRDNTTKKISISNFLLEFLKNGFFDIPRQLSDITMALSDIGYIYPSTSLTSPLQRMLKKRELGRIKKDGRWFYVKR